MRKKFLSGILLVILLFSDFCAPLTYAIDSSEASAIPSSSLHQVERNQNIKVVAQAIDAQTKSNLEKVTWILRDKEDGKELDRWDSSDKGKEHFLEKGKSYLLSASKEGYENLTDEVIRVSEEGKLLLRGSEEWIEQEEGKISLELVKKLVELKSQPVILPKISFVNEDLDSTPTSTFKLIKENDSSIVAEWASNDDSPSVNLEFGQIYRIQILNLRGGYIQPEDISIRLTSDGQFERLKDEKWEIFTQLDIPLTKMSAFRTGSKTPIAPTQPITSGMIAPINKLQIPKNIPNPSVQILAKGSGVARTQDFHTKGTSLWEGEFINGYDGNIAGSALGVGFTPANQSASNFKKNPNAGWNTKDLSLSSTNMWIKVRYTNAAYYEGRLVDAIATIKVTPYKNRNKNAVWWVREYGGVYTPVIQIGYSLYNGWSWQNVKEINIELQFYEKGANTPIQFQGGSYNDEEATYYTINSLNPASVFNDLAYGPEYVLPANGSYTAAYTIGSKSHIKIYYDGWKGGKQYAYNGGVEAWDGDNHGANWSQNSVLLTTSNTNKLSFTMGNLERNPALPDGVPKTNYIWATISTDAFTGTYVKYKDIPIQKIWSDPEYEHPEITVELYATWKENGVAKKKLRQAQKLSKGNNWKSSFVQVPDEDSMLKIIQKSSPGKKITDFKYEIKEKNKPDGYNETHSGDSKGTSGFTVTNAKIVTGLTVKKIWWSDSKNQEIVYSDTKNLKPVTVHLKRKSNGTIDSTFDKIMKLTYANHWKVEESNLAIKDGMGKDYTYFIEEEKNTLSDNFVLKNYSSPNGIILNTDKSKNNLSVTNAEILVNLTVQKLWYDKDNHGIANAQLPKKLEVKLYRTTNGKTSGGTLVGTIQLERSTTTPYVWKKTGRYPYKEKSTGKYYTYYIEEVVPKYYLEISNASEKKVTFTDTNIGETATLTVKNKVNPTYPNTGGSGILPYLVLGIISLFTAVILYYMQKTERFLGGK